MESAKPQPEDVLGDTKGEDNTLQSIDQLELPPEKVTWLLTLFELYFHVGTLYAIKLILTGRVGLASVTTGIVLGYVGLFGVTIGAHRLWSHRSFKAKIGLRYFLAICQSIAIQGPILQWVTWHRVHHKFSDTKLDPHNASRGFFYSHVGWIMTYNPKLYAIQRSYANVEDAEADPVVMWQEKYYDLLMSLAIIIPPFIPWLFFNEEFASAWYVTVCARIAITQNCIFSINSLAHLVGYRPYDKGIYARENKLVAILSVGEGWHNYHHTFPWDYRQSEFGGSLMLHQPNWSANIIDFFAKMGWAYDLKIATPELVEARMKRTGDGGIEIQAQNN